MTPEPNPPTPTPSEQKTHTPITCPYCGSARSVGTHQGWEYRCGTRVYDNPAANGRTLVCLATAEKKADKARIASLETDLAAMSAEVERAKLALSSLQESVRHAREHNQNWQAKAERLEDESLTLRASIAEKDEALRKIQKDAETAINFGTDEHAIFSEIYVTTEGALSSTGSELMERLKKAEAERAEEWRKNRELRSENDTLRASLDDVNASRDRLGKALEELRGAISTFKGHGMPGFTDRALALIVIGETDAALAEWRGEK
jgi:predicted RNase H-like nuclease (RuvC/YqgF family)